MPPNSGDAHRHVAVVEDDRDGEAVAQRRGNAAGVRHRHGEDEHGVGPLALDELLEVPPPARRDPTPDRLARQLVERALVGRLFRAAQVAVALEPREPVAHARVALPRGRSGSEPCATTGSRPAARGTASRRVDAGLVEPLPELPPGGRAAVAEVEVDRRGKARILAPCIQISLGVWDEGHATVAAPWPRDACSRCSPHSRPCGSGSRSLQSRPGDEAARHPAYWWRGLEGDANGYYAAAREALAASRSPVVAATAVLALALGVERPGCCGAATSGVAQVLAGGAGVAGCATAVTAGMEPPGAPVVGWPLLWAVPLAPLRIFGEPTIDAAWTAGVALSLACVAIATVACGLLGRWAPGRTRSVSARPPCSRRGRSSSARSRAGRHGRTARGSRTPACTSTRSRSRRRSS